ncbi:MAG: helix-turn-helix transcriptional regulator [Flavobacterium sp.]|nr:helix-turn-helix transcriptional regulator [Flavobacterium sp.]
MNIYREITPLNENDCFLVFERSRNIFNFPIHFHPEYEINFIYNAKGAKRTVGDHIEEIDNYELVMVGPNIYHGWEDYKNNPENTLHEITIQFPRNLFDSLILKKNILQPIKELFTSANQGILFSTETAIKLESKLRSLNSSNGFENLLTFQSLLYDLAISKNKKLLSSISFKETTDFFKSEKIEKFFNYVKTNYQNTIRVEEAASVINMTVISFSRLIKQQTGKTFIEFVNELRLGVAARMLIETNDSISEICFVCGFNNISNFNRLFKKSKKCSPSEFRNNFIGTKNIF